MADNTKIEWTDATWNPITGCSVTSPGCTNCYAMKLAGTRLKHHPSRAGLTHNTKDKHSSSGAVVRKGSPVWTGEVRFNEAALTQPLHWKRPRRARRKGCDMTQDINVAEWLAAKVQTDDPFLVSYLTGWAGLSEPEPWGAAMSFVMEMAWCYGLIRSESDATLTALGCKVAAILKGQSDAE